MTVLQDLQGISVEGNLVVEVLLHEGLHGDLVPAAVCGLVCGILEGKVVLDWATWQDNLFILAGTEVGEEVPETDEDGDSGDETKEDGGLQTAADLP